MPITFVQKLAKKYHVSLEIAESYWEEAKELAEKAYDEDKESDKFYAATTNIFKNIIRKRSRVEAEVESKIMNFEQFINENYN